MRIIIQFLNPINVGRVLEELTHVKKGCAVLRHYISEVTDDKYYLKDQNGNLVAEFEYMISEDEDAVVFENFRGQLQEDIRRMLQFKLVERCCEKAFVFDTEKKTKLFFTLDNFFLIEKNNTFYKMGLDYEAIMPVSIGMVPKELKLPQN